MNKKRLLKLADLLEADANNKKGIKFDINVIACKSKTYDHFKPDELPELSCGTAACAVGLACISGAFKREGLSYFIEDDGGIIPVFGEFRDWHCAEMEFFGLNEGESNFLFRDYPERKQRGAAGERYVAKRIRDFVAGKVAP